MGIKFTIDNKGTLSHLNDLTKIPKELIKDAYDVFKENTPYRSGNARSKTYLGGNEIRAEYPYAARLDDGYSKKRPDGMIKPTVEFIDQQLKKLVEKK